MRGSRRFVSGVVDLAITITAARCQRLFWILRLADPGSRFRRAPIAVSTHSLYNRMVHPLVLAKIRVADRLRRQASILGLVSIRLPFWPYRRLADLVLRHDQKRLSACLFRWALLGRIAIRWQAKHRG
ncbi:hypothetical protein LINGRAHAP2_LOCUS36306 [Linum grandiflorum]